VPIAPRGSTLLGISFRPPQVETLGLDARASLHELLAFPFHLIRLGAYWSRIEPEDGQFCPAELDWQLDAAEKAGKQIILCVGAVKTFGYPEFFVPTHQLCKPLREGYLVQPAAHRPLLSAATEFIQRIVERYRDRKAIVAWQVEHEAVDPLGMEHSWRLAAGFVKDEVKSVREADPTRPIVMSGYLPTSLPVRMLQWWRTRDQRDSLSVAHRLADIVGVDYYPRHALVNVGPMTLYLDGSNSPWQHWWEDQWRASVRASRRRLVITEGQAEPWEAVTTPPNPPAHVMYSCMPEQVIENYNHCMSWAPPDSSELYAYLFWGAEYWLSRKQCGDTGYLRAFARVLQRS
jgi:hypothetical protein